MSATTIDLADAWDDLHAQDRFRPLYPSEWVVRFAARHLADTRGARVLDLGCGAGRHSLLALDHDATVTAFDLSVAGLVHTRDRLTNRSRRSSQVAAGRYEALPFADARFDAVICFGVLYYGDGASLRRGVDEIKRVLRPGGSALIVLRSTTDHRHGLGAQIERDTFVLDSPETNEVGMSMHFVDRAALDDVFAGFSNVDVERHDHTTGGETVLNADWIVDARR